MSAPLQIGLVLFPKVTQLDFTGPLQVFSSVPGAKVHLIWKRIEPVPTDSVLVLTPTTTFADCPQLDVICVPGGAGTDDMVNDEEMLAFLRKQAAGAKYVTSVCTGSLVLGAAGLVAGLPGGDALDGDGFSGPVRRDTDQNAGLRRSQPGYRRRRHRGHRFCADAGLDPVDRTPRKRSAPARIQSGAAVQCRLARHRAAGSARLHEGRIAPAQIRRGERSAAAARLS